MSQYTFKQILRYRFDNFMAKGGRSIFISLTLVFLSLLGLISLAVLQDLHLATDLGEEQLTVDRIEGILFKTVADAPDAFNPGALDLFARHFDALQRAQPYTCRTPAAEKEAV